jgi:glycosyltransferase involved in cell wall biosynthesis
VVRYFKKRDGARTYLLLKDIFPQNAVDIGLMAKSGLKGLLYRYFRGKEKQLYALSDRIGCMSEANREYVIRNNPEVKPEKVEVCPNSIEVMDMGISSEERAEMRDKYGIPLDKKVFVYGGNFGKPQDIPFVIRCLKTQLKNPNAFFLLVGDGTDFKKMEAFFQEEDPSNMKLLQRLPKEDYDRMVSACDVGMIFLDHRFTIPNFPSRLLIYMQAGLPVLCCTDTATDMGKIVTENNFGWWCESNDVAAFNKTVNSVLEADLNEAGQNAFQYLKHNYSCEKSYNMIL